ncbi:MdtA/MuxA family multidrug efflux RND transporter periplasmic adaptor subunit [uncultured Desulfovibrio sp.]|uniref:MdtA/MuxA family multidrug efflux RND transporter periplasmic adaptor subunit n=1 Tax=uncultured Desulfovibrio sp. TaxID=167968 RepID=UPI00262D2C38|nr:MdtA/MuxA family multidrug efflux RND transporter periplasmic adaptor subunit [uncultured Desulfovibrio sp.]
MQQSILSSPTGSPRRGRRLLFVLVLLAIAAAAFLLFGKKGGRGPMPAPTVPVRVATVRQQSMPHFLNGLGTVTPSADVLVTSRVDGQLMRLHFTEGQHVSAGDLLAEIDPRPFEAALAEARGTLARDKAQLVNARRDLDRYAKLAAGDYIARQQYESQRATVRQYEGTVAADEAAVQSAALQLEYSRIVAPVSGRLGLRNVDEGNMIKASDTEGLVRITEITPCYVVFTLPENRVPLVGTALRRTREGAARPLVQAWDREQKNLLAFGELLSMDNRIDQATGTVRLKAQFANEKLSLYPNQFVNARVLVAELPDALTIPTAAVQLGSRGSYVYVIDKENIAHVRTITPGIATNSLTVVDKGLQAGETVVVDGLDRLRDGLRVKIAATVETPQAEDIRPAL